MIDTSKIPGSKGDYKTIKKNGSTADIIASIQKIDKYYDPNFCIFAQQFEGAGGLKKLWSFVKYQITYKKDDFNTSKQLTPAALWEYKKGDCKSKTLFINAVLRCLKIPYLTRYTTYNKNDKEVKHVYTVALINGRELPIDSVYEWFGAEKKFYKKIDYPMAEIIEISGLESGRNLPTKNTIQYRPNRCLTPIPVTERSKIVAEIKQKQKYVKKPEPIKFNRISEGQATIQIAIRELEIVKVMKPELAKIADKGLKLLRQAKKGNFCPTGQIPNQLAGTYQKIKIAERQQHIKANGYGLAAQRTKQNNQSGIHGEFTGMFCLNGLFRQQNWKTEHNYNTQTLEVVPDNFNYVSPSQNWLKFHSGMCMRNWGDWGDISLKNVKQFDPTDIYKAYSRMPGTVPPGYQIPTGYNLGDNSYFGYGSESKYRTTFNEMRSDFEAAITSLIDRNIAKPKADNVANSGDYSVYIENKANYDILIEELNQSSGVLSKYMNDMYAANAVDTPNGTLGTGLIYSFADGMSLGGQAINLNRLPGTVLTKRGFQDQFIDSTFLFAGVSKSSVKGLARNGVLFDNGGTQPESTLNSLLAIYENRYNTTSINEPISAIVASIAALVVAIIGAIAAAVIKGEEATRQAKVIDDYNANQSRMVPPTIGNMPGQDDFMPLELHKEDPKSYLALLGAAGLLGGYALIKDKK